MYPDDPTASSAFPRGGLPSLNRQSHPPTTGKGSADSVYWSHETSAMAGDQDIDQSSGAEEDTTLKEASGSSPHSDSPVKSHQSAVSKACGIAKSDSTKTHRSIPYIGSVPLGRLHIHCADDPPKASATGNNNIAEAESLPSSPPPTPPRCLDNGDCFVIIDLPDEFTIGLDTIALTTRDGMKFKGFRDIPPGPHFLWLSESGAISRCGYWFVTGEQGQVRVKQWDKYNEVLGEAASMFEVREHKKKIEETYPRLMPHNFQGDAASTIAPPPPPPKDRPRRGSVLDLDFTGDNIAIWHQLTSGTTPSFLDRVTGKKRVTEWLVDTTDGAKGEFRSKEATRLLKAISGSQLDFLFQQDIIDLHLLNIAAGDQAGNDTTSRIVALLNKNSTNLNLASSLSSLPPTPTVTETDIIADLQFTFLTGLHLGSYTCIEQWWHLLLKIILRAHHLVLSRPHLTSCILLTFHCQMVYNDRYIDHAAVAEHPDHSTDPYQTAAGAGRDGEVSTNSILETIPRNKAKLREALTVYKRRLNQALLGERNKISPEQAAVGQAFAGLEAWFWRYGWDLRSDYEDQREAGADAAAASGRMVLSDSDSEDERGEYAPQFVELDERGREVGLVNFDE